MEVHKNVIDEFECPVCRDLMDAPIRMCNEGHSYCNDCYQQVSACPICRGSQDGARNFLLEKFSRHILFHCANRSDGCNYNGKLEIVKEHVKHCQYSLGECPLHFEHCCNWVGLNQNVMEHCLSEHPNNAYMSNSQRLICNDFLGNAKSYLAQIKHYNIIFEAFGELFKCTWDMNCITGLIVWKVIYFGSTEDAAKYTFTVKFTHPLNDDRVFCIEGFCQSAQLTSTSTEQITVSTNKKSVGRFCANKQLHYTVTIQSSEQKSVQGATVNNKNISPMCTYTPELCICSNPR